MGGAEYLSDFLSSIVSLPIGRNDYLKNLVIAVAFSAFLLKENSDATWFIFLFSGPSQVQSPDIRDFRDPIPSGQSKLSVSR